MNTSNNAAALERLEQKWRDEASAEWAHCQNKELPEWIRDRCYGKQNRLISCANELATLRATPAQPDALTSQPSGEAVAIPVVQQTAPERIWLAVADDAYYADKPFPDGEEVCWSSDAPLQVCVPYVRADLATHPSADAQGVAVDEAMVDRAAKAYCKWFVCGSNGVNTLALRAALTAALAPKPEGGHG